LKLNRDELLSRFAFNFNFRRYIKGGADAEFVNARGETCLMTCAKRANMVGAVQVDPMHPRVESALVS